MHENFMQGKNVVLTILHTWKLSGYLKHNILNLKDFS